MENRNKDELEDTLLAIVIIWFGGVFFMVVGWASLDLVKIVLGNVFFIAGWGYKIKYTSQNRSKQKMKDG